MKKIYSLFLAIMVSATMSAQLVTEIVSPGVFKLTYGAANDYSFYDPGFGTPTFWVHTWITTADNSAGISYDDSWANSNVTMDWDATANAYVGYINLNTKTFTNTNNTVAGGTTVQKVGIVFKNQQNGATAQSADGSVVGPTTLPTMAVSDAALAKKSIVVDGKLYTAKKGALTVKVYDFSGKLLKNTTVKADGNAIELNLPKNGNYILNLSDAQSAESIKFRY